MSGRGVYVALSGALAQQQSLDVTANNLANAQTEGYVRSRVVFREVLARAGGGGSPDRWVATSESVLDTAQGSLRTTGGALDVALPAGTFLAVSTQGGERYTRAGALTMSKTGAIVTAAGDPVMGESGTPLSLDPAIPPSITREGDVVQDGKTVGRLKLVSFDKPERLVHEGGGRLAATAQSGAATASKATLEIGAVEDSNASVTSAMTEIVSASRAFEAFQRAIQTFHDEDRRLVTTVPSAGG